MAAICVSESSTNAFSTPVDTLSLKSHISLNPINPPANSPEPSGKAPHHIYNKKRKWLLVYIVSLAAMFSPLSSNIYFPAIDTIASDLNTNTSLVALTVTVYMVVQGIAPSFWGPWSDIYGRRVIFIGTLIVYVAANLALAFTVNYPMLLVLRGVQAAGSAATISIGTGVIADIALPSERGGFIGTNSGIRMIGQALGPVLGGILNGIWGFRSIFWFLFALSILVLLTLLAFLPETHRDIAGNGSVPLHGVHKPFIYWIISEPTEWVRSPSTTPGRKTPSVTFKSVLTPLKHLFEKDIFLLLAWGALIYAVWSMVTSSTTTVLKHEFPSLTDVELGLCFLPNGVGCVLGSISTGKLMDRNFRMVAKHYRRQHQIPDDVEIKGDKSFPYERARLSPMPYLSAVFIIVTALYGASYELNDVNRKAIANLLISLALQFLIAFTATAIFSINSAMMVDCFPSGGAGATAVNNLARCSLGAVGVSVVQPMINAIRIRNTFVVLAAVVALCSPMVWVEWKWGEKWRTDREKRKGASLGL
ncbi:major facilitator superfamily domain-containing protein [Talaromyces proteolyticus]|uniref:Major facilitator superfamily domain-containing protein n=1 Tax=Talaromyces proteolyticus TaxID=1131652 RepID=A0AAD4PSJ3_9EURO|nr:major facilitator superfamily domain-containing protein [Talaromyces proteolyticus]KAH8691476.1 major facilitator superfamily domain-containing protein [Talaromyces proteolyticus]